jgi:hypothetical protein
LKQTVVGNGETLSEKHGGFGLTADMRHTVLVSLDEHLGVVRGRQSDIRVVVTDSWLNAEYNGCQ